MAVTCGIMVARESASSSPVFLRESEHKLFDVKMLHQTKPLNMYLSQSTMSQVLIISYSLDIKLQTFFFYSTHNFCVKILYC